MSHYKVLVMNTKGGVGKSTVSTQIIIPFLYRLSKEKVRYFELDDENKGVQSFDNCDIIDNISISVQHSELRDQLADILLEDGSVCIDVGANKTTTQLYGALIDSGMLNAIDLIVIPLMDGEVDAYSAVNLYLNVRKMNEKVKVMFVLNRVNKTRNLFFQFESFLGDKRGFFDTRGMIEHVAPEDQNYITVIDSDAVKVSQKFSTTVWELARTDKNLDEEIKVALANNVSKNDIRYLSYKRGVQQDCIEYYNAVLRPAFEKLQNLLELS